MRPLLPRCRSALTATMVAALLLSVPVGAQAEPSPPTPTPTTLERTEPDRLLAQIDPEHPITPLQFRPTDLVPVPGTPFRLRAEANEHLGDLFAAAADDGHGLRVISGFRSYDTQARTHESWVAQYGQEAEQLSARAGHSEHQLGVAVDVDSTAGGCYLDACFGRSAEGRWVAEHAHEFGFVLSYPQGAQRVTGFRYEPWHLRYVGPRTAQAMERADVDLLVHWLSRPYRSAAVGSALGS